METKRASRAPARRSVVAFILFHLVYLLLPGAAILIPTCLLFTPCAAWGAVAIAGYFAWFAATVSSETDGKGRPWPAFEQLGLWSYLFAYFPLKLERLGPPLKTTADGGKYLLCAHPHGLLCFNRAMFGFATQLFWHRAFPGLQFRVLAATAALRVPVIREMWLWSYCIDARRASARAALDQGHSLVLYPGGEREQLLTVRGCQRVHLSDRKGFVKLALQTGAALVPIYVFGETDLFTHHQFGIGLRRSIQRAAGAAIPFPFTGACGLLPFRVPVTAVAGMPLPATQPIADPSQAQIDEHHAAFVTALIALFEAHKARLGFADAHLEVV